MRIGRRVVALASVVLQTLIRHAQGVDLLVQVEVGEDLMVIEVGESIDVR